MYSRKLRQPNKKRRNSITKTKGGGSNWGPRIALYEREKAAAAVSETNTNNQTDGANHGLKHGPGLPTYYKRRERRSSISYSSMSSGPLSQSASSSSYIYNSGSQIKSSESGSTSKGTDSALYTLHSSVFTDDEEGEPHHRNENDLTHEAELTRPLSLLIPPQNVYDLDFEKSRRLDEDSLASTQTYRSSCDEEPTSPPEVVQNESINNQIQATGILQVSTTQPQIHPCPPEKLEAGARQHAEANSSSASKNHKLNKEEGIRKQKHYGHDQGSTRSSYKSLARDLPIDSPVATLKGKVDGSTIAALAQGTLVYVPMESVPRSKSAAAINTIGRVKGKRHEGNNDDGNDTDDEESLYDEATFEPKCSSPVSTPNFPSMQQDVEQEMESSLQSFDSTLFKKMTSPVKGAMKKSHTSETFLSASDNNVSEAQDCVDNECGGGSCKPVDSERQIKSIRFSEINVEIPASRQSERDETGDQSSSEEKYRVQKVTLTLPGQDPPCEQELLINYSNVTDHYSCTMLSCGHTKTDNYSTLSSIASRQISEVDGDFSERTSVDTRSALQQLRDLSLLIGGSFHNSAAEKENKRSFRLHESTRAICSSTSTRKDLREEITDDSGKGSGSSRTQTSSDASPQAGCSSLESSPNSLSINNNSEHETKKEMPTEAKNSSNIRDSNHQKPGEPNKSSHGNIHPVPSKCPCGKRSCLFHTDCEECIKLLTENPYERPLTARIWCNSSNSNNNNITRKRGDKGFKNAMLMRKNSNRSSINSSSRRKSAAIVKLKRTPSKTYNVNNTNMLMKGGRGHGPKKPTVLLEYCDCDRCEQMYAQIGDGVISSSGAVVDNKVMISRMNDRNSSSYGSVESSDRNRKISSSSSSSSKLNRSVAFREKSGKRQSLPGYQLNKSGNNVDSCSQLHPMIIQQSGVFIRGGYPNVNNPICCNGRHNNMSKSGLFTIEEREESLYNGGNTFCNVSNNSKDKRMRNRQRMEARTMVPPSPADFSKEKNWGIPDAAFGWSDLESLYSQNMKNESPAKLNDDCWTCWKEVAESKKTSVDPNRTVDRTKRMFIWLNRRQKEYQAPWWEVIK